MIKSLYLLLFIKCRTTIVIVVVVIAGLLLLSISGEMLNLSSADITAQLLRQNQSLVDTTNGVVEQPLTSDVSNSRSGQIVVAKLLDRRIGTVHLDENFDKSNTSTVVPSSSEFPIPTSNTPSSFYNGPASTPSLDALYASILPQKKRQFDWSTNDVIHSRVLDSSSSVSLFGVESAPSTSVQWSTTSEDDMMISTPSSSLSFEKDLSAVQAFFSASLVATPSYTSEVTTSTNAVSKSSRSTKKK